MPQFKLAATRATLFSLVLLLAGCGGGNSDSDDSKFTIAGTVSGLTGTSVTLRLNNGLDLILIANGAFHFSTKVDPGGAYAVTVQSQPQTPWQTCTVTDGTGTANADVSNVSVTCTTNSYKVGGKLTGLIAGTGPIVLQNNGIDDISMSADGDFQFATPVVSGGAVKVTVLTQPSGSPPQICVVTGGTGFMGGADVTAVAVTCKKTYSVGGTVAGLAGSGLVLRNSGGDDLTVSANGTFTFSTRVATGGAYAVTVKTQPTSPTQQCSVTSGSGTIAAIDITNVAVNCVTASGVSGNSSVSGVVRGLDVPGLVLRNSAGDELTVNSNGTFKFATLLPPGATYNVTVVAGTPATPRHVCKVLNGSGTIGANSEATNVDITCEADRFAYVLHPAQVTALVANHETGALSPIEGTATFATAPGALDIASDPRGRFVYVASYSPETAQSFISGYRVDASSGALTSLPGSPFAAGTAATRRLAIDSAGRFLYAANATSGKVTGWAIHASGTLTPVQASPQALGDAPCETPQAPLSSSHFVVSSASSQLMLFGKEADSSQEWLATETLASGSYCGAATDPYGHFVYVPRLDKAASYLYGFSVGENGASLEPLTLNPVAPTNTYTLSAQQPRAMVLRNSRRDREMLQIP